MYTTNDLIVDCVGQFIENQRYSINRSSLLNDIQYCEVWRCLLQWTEKQIKRKNSFIIPHFGLIKYNKYNTNKNWKFYIKSCYVNEENAKLGIKTDIDLITNDDLHISSAIKCHISSLLKYSSTLSESQLLVGLKHIFLKLSQQISRSAISTKNYCDIDNFQSHLKIIINFGWGYLSVSHGIIDFIFTMNESFIINPNIPNGLKNIPKKYLQSTSSLISISSIPSNIKITNNNTAIITKQLQEKYKKKYKLPINNDYDNPLIYLASHHTILESSHQKSQFPMVLSEFSRTLGSTYCNHTNYQAPSSKIGLFYTPTSSLYRININKKKIEYTDYLPFFQSNPEKYYQENAKKLLFYELKYKTNHATKKQEISALDLEIACSCKRYHEYIHNRMTHHFIPSLRDDLIAKILNKLEPDLTLISQDTVEKILEENLNIIQSQYLIAIKQSILDYILKNKNERKRLNILIPPHHINEWGYSYLPYSAPLSWSIRLKQSWNIINNESYFINHAIIEMLSLWQNYADYRLFAIPNSLKIDNNIENEDNNKNNNNMPMSIEEFRDEQDKHLEFVRNIFINNWYNDSVNIMKKYVEENGLDSSEKSTLKLFSAIAAFMSSSLCQIIYESLKDCMTFFEKYQNAPIAELYNGNNNVLNIKSVSLSTARDIQPLWIIGMEVSRDGIHFEIPLQDIHITINDMIQNIITCFHGISCVEGKIFGLMIDNVPNLRVYIDDDIKQKSRDKILNITSLFIKELEYLQQLYSNQFSPLFAANNELTQRLIEIENDDNINDKHQLLIVFKKEIKKYQEIRDNVINKAHYRLRMGLFQIQCENINKLIINHAEDLKNGITNHVAKQLIDKSQKLVINYENGSKQLLKKPENAQELINLINYIQLFDKSLLFEWQNISDEIGKELIFLFDTNHNLSHDLLRSVGRVSDWNKKIIQHKKIANQHSKTQREFIETTIIEKSKQFQQKIKKMYKEVEDLKLLSEIRDISKIHTLKENMQYIEKEKIYLNHQQKLLQIHESEFKLYKLLQDAVSKL